ncbi:hypothetical protein Gotur_029198 [Gossypium turneri]
MFARLVVCIDLKKPLVSKVKINGHTQHMEYKSLLNVCFRCGLYRHSVPTKKWNMIRVRMGDTMNEDDDNLFGGFSFTSLDENHGGIESEILTHNEGVQLGNNKAQDHVTRLSRETGNFVAKNKKFPKKSIQRVKGKDIVIGNGPKTSFKALKPTNGNVGSSSKFGQDKFKDGSKMGRKASAGKEGQLSFQPVSINSNLDKDKHKAVRVFAKGSSGTTMGKENGFFLFGKKPLDSVSMISIPTKMDMTASIEGIVREIERGFGISNMEDDVPSLVKVRDDGINCTDEISGIQVDGVIAKLGFPNSFQIEANGFSGGVWVVWNENILIDILELHPQMIYMRFKVVVVTLKLTKNQEESATFPQFMVSHPWKKFQKMDTPIFSKLAPLSHLQIRAYFSLFQSSLTHSSFSPLSTLLAIFALHAYHHPCIRIFSKISLLKNPWSATLENHQKRSKAKKRRRLVSQSLGSQPL